jgi:hypothetical protein
MVVCPFVLFLSAIVLSVVLGLTDSDCHFVICKLFLILCDFDYPVYALFGLKRLFDYLAFQYFDISIHNEDYSTNASCSLN